MCVRNIHVAACLHISMTHLPPHTAIFSPSVAQQAASAAKDWAYLDHWLATKYMGRSPPPFERNADTLRALLALASLNQSSDETRTQLAEVESDALYDLHHLNEANHANPNCLASFRRGFFDALESHLTRDGTASLDAMAKAAVQLSIAIPEPAQLSRGLVNLQTRVYTFEQAAARMGVLKRYIDGENLRMEVLLGKLGDDVYRPPPNLARGNLEMQRMVEALSTKQLPHMRDVIASLAHAVGVPRPTIEDLRKEEAAYLALLRKKRILDQKIADFEGLPSDIELARRELDALRRELLTITQRRDALFENLVERPTPYKAR